MIDRGVAGYRGDPTAGLPWGRPEVLARRIVRAIKRRRSMVVFPFSYWFRWWFPRFCRMAMDAIPTEASDEQSTVSPCHAALSTCRGERPSGGSSKAKVASRLSRGELKFDDDIGLPDREAITEMWVNRVSGFHNLRIDQYLRDSDAASRCVMAGRVWSDRNMRRLCSVVFPAQRMAQLVGLGFSLELLDAHTCREQDGFVTSCIAVVYVARCIVRQTRLRMSILRRGDTTRPGS